MTREQKIWRLNEHCGIRRCMTCELYQECENNVGKAFKELDTTTIDKMYNKAFGTPITQSLTGVVKEDHEKSKTVTDILEEVKTEMCDGYCIYPMITPGDYERYKRICNEECPLNKL